MQANLRGNQRANIGGVYISSLWERCVAKLAIVGDEEWTFKTPKEVKLGGESHYQIPILQLAQLKSNGMAHKRFSNAGPVRYMDVRNGEEVFRSFREVKHGKDIGRTQFYEYQDKKYVLKEGYRAWYMHLLDSLMDGGTS